MGDRSHVCTHHGVRSTPSPGAALGAEGLPVGPSSPPGRGPGGCLEGAFSPALGWLPSCFPRKTPSASRHTAFCSLPSLPTCPAQLTRFVSRLQGKAETSRGPSFFFPPPKGKRCLCIPAAPRASSQRRRHPSSRQRPAPPHAPDPTPSAFSRSLLRQLPSLTLHCPRFPPSWDIPSHLQTPSLSNQV